MTRREFLGMVDRCRMSADERSDRHLPTAEQDVRRVLDEAYPVLKKSKEWETCDDSN